MDGLADLFKHFFASRLSSAALLVTTLVLAFAGHFTPHVPEVPASWLWAVYAVMVFTTVQCGWWIAEAMTASIQKTLRNAAKALMPVQVEHLS